LIIVLLCFVQVKGCTIKNNNAGIEEHELHTRCLIKCLTRLFGGDQIEADTNKVVGTYGYMPPEYVVDGRFSLKSDVFSFGVLVLEIISGKKNRGFSHPDHCHNLLGH
ncbi:hypothetical protein D5086_006188, partial [Populus alba]